MKQINENVFEEEVLKAEQLVVVDFTAPWCGPCRAMMPLLEKVEKENPTVKFVKINIDDNPELCMKYMVDKVPTMLFMKKGKVEMRTIGALKESDLNAIIADKQKPKADYMPQPKMD